MANSIRDAKTAALGAMMDVAQVIQDFTLEWMLPEVRRAQAVVEKQLLAEWDANADEIEAMQEQDPEQYKLAQRQINDIRKRYGG